MRQYNVTVEDLTYEDRVYNTETFNIMAKSKEEAIKIVHNHKVLTYEQRFRIASVELIEGTERNAYL